MKITIGENDICNTCKYKNPLICTITGCQPTEKDCPAVGDDVFFDDTRNLSDCNCYIAKAKKKRNTDPVIAEIIEHLNKKAEKNFRANTKDTVKKINARLGEGFSIDDFKKVINVKVSDWKDTEMDKYLNPGTLFRTENFEKYLNQREIKPKDKLQSKPSYSMDEIKRRAMENTEI